ncbi:hypothetical protein GCM10028827_02290 [Mucilaginibacter myungsuensis]
MILTFFWAKAGDTKATETKAEKAQVNKNFINSFLKLVNNANYCFNVAFERGN